MSVTGLAMPRSALHRGASMRDICEESMCKMRESKCVLLGLRASLEIPIPASEHMRPVSSVGLPAHSNRSCSALARFAGQLRMYEQMSARSYSARRQGRTASRGRVVHGPLAAVL